MSTRRTRDLTLERVRRFRAKQRGETPTTPDRVCTHCAAKLSRYAEPETTLCWSCFATHGTHEEYVDAEAYRTGEQRLSEYVCKRGHDLELHGQLVPAGDGRHTRRCGICRKERQKISARNRRARLTQATA